MSIYKPPSCQICYTLLFYLRLCCSVCYLFCRIFLYIYLLINSNTLTYLQNPISTTVHAPTDVELLERADSSENTIWKKKNSVGNPAKFALKLLSRAASAHFEHSVTCKRDCERCKADPFHEFMDNIRILYHVNYLFFCILIKCVFKTRVPLTFLFLKSIQILLKRLNRVSKE